MGNKMLINENKTVIDALNMLNNFKVNDGISKLILFVESNRKIIGSITDGDVRRNLILKGNLNQKVKDICTKILSM